MTLSQLSVLVVGAGRIGQALVAGWLSGRDDMPPALTARQVVVANPSEGKRAVLAKRFGVDGHASAEAAYRACPGGFDVVVLAVKPPAIVPVLVNLRACVSDALLRRPLFVSLAGGVTTGSMEQALPAGARVVRAMPNMPLVVGHGATALAAGARATKEDIACAVELFSCVGVALEVEEGALDAVCGLSGSGPAYVAAFARALAEAGCAQGLPTALASRLALATIAGTAAYLEHTGQDPAQLEHAVASPGGTTVAGLAVLEQAGFAEAVIAAVNAATRRSKELGQCSQD